MRNLDLREEDVALLVASSARIMEDPIVDVTEEEFQFATSPFQIVPNLHLRLEEGTEQVILEKPLDVMTFKEVIESAHAQYLNGEGLGE